MDSPVNDCSNLLTSQKAQLKLALVEAANKWYEGLYFGNAREEAQQSAIILRVAQELFDSSNGYNEHVNQSYIAEDGRRK